MSDPHEEPNADVNRSASGDASADPIIRSVPSPAQPDSPPAEPPYRRSRRARHAAVDEQQAPAEPPSHPVLFPETAPTLPSSPPPAPQPAPSLAEPALPSPEPVLPVQSAADPVIPGLSDPEPELPEPGPRRGQPAARERQSFLQTERPEEPAREGVRGALNRIGFRLPPGETEQATRDDELAVSQHWPGPRTIAVVNGKGGAGKTPTTILLSAVFARYGGAGVLAWDNNQTRGTLGWRTETGAHDRTLLEMLPEAGRLLGTSAQSADLAHFVHHQPREKYDVLRSKPIRLAHENRVNPDDVDAIHAVAAKFYRLIIIDSGNDESDPMWLRMIDRADQIVVATTTRDDHAEAGALLLEALEERDERSARLAKQSVVVVSQADPKATPADVSHVVDGYRSLARDVVSIPFDHEMVDGHLRYSSLAKRTQRAWLAAAASVARGL